MVKDVQTNIKNNDIISLLPIDKVKKNETFEFKFISCIKSEIKIMKNEDQEDQEKREEKENKEEKEVKKVKTSDIEKLGTEMNCGICLDYIFECVSILDCLHNFCGGCLSDWINKNNKQCPQCRAEIIAVKKNSLVNNIIIQFLEINPEKKRPEDEYKELKRKNNFKQDRVEFNVSLSKAQKKQLNQQLMDQHKMQIINQQKCQECNQMRVQDGFKCKVNQIHLSCNNCQKQFPNRPQFNNQTCVICKLAFCNLYYDNDCINPLTFSNNQLKTVKERSINMDIHMDIFNNNRDEQQHLMKYLRGQQMNAKDVYRQIMDKGQFEYRKHKSLIKNIDVSVDERIKIEEESVLCSNCYSCFWFQLVIKFVMEVRQKMDPMVANRPDCYYGVNCNTMVHNHIHRNKYNHILPQYKF